jgi:ribonuclease P protein component
VLVSKGSPGPPRVAFVAGKGVGNAVRRNRAKRRLRAAMARIRLRDGLTYVVIARRGVVDASFQSLVSWLDAAVRSTDDAQPTKKAPPGAAKQEML